MTGVWWIGVRGFLRQHRSEVPGADVPSDALVEKIRVYFTLRAFGLESAFCWPISLSLGIFVP